MENRVYDVVIVGAGPGGLYAAYSLVSQSNKDLSILIIDKGNSLEKRKCPIGENGITECVNCASCSIMTGYGGCGSFSDGKFNITNDFGGTLWEKIGKDKAIQLMKEVDDVNRNLLSYKSQSVGFPKMYTSNGSKFHKICIQHDLRLLDADIRHLGTDLNYVILKNMYDYLVSRNVEFLFNTFIKDIVKDSQFYKLIDENKDEIVAKDCIVSVGRSGSKWLNWYCDDKSIPTTSNKVDIGVRVELPYEVFSDLTDDLYESKIVYHTKKYEDNVRTFCMNPNGIVVAENTNGIKTVNGHSFESPLKKSKNTNFALLVSQKFTEPFKSSNDYGESIARMSNMLGGGVIVQRFGDLIRGKRSTKERIASSSVSPTLGAEPGDLSLVLPKRILDDIIEMLYALDKIAPGTANDDTLLYGVEVKFYNMEVKVDNHLQTQNGMYMIGDGSGITHSLSQAAASGMYVANLILNK